MQRGFLAMLGTWRIVVIVVVTVGMSSSVRLDAQRASENNVPPSPHGAALFATHCSVCHGADGQGGERAPNIATAPGARQLSRDNLIEIVKNGIPGGGMPAFGSLGDEKVTAVVDYLRTLQGKGTVVKLPGDPQTGKTLFFGSARCSVCHMVNGQGGFIGSDLSLYGTHATVDQARDVILDPDKNLPAQSKATTVVTRQGKRYVGLVRNNNNFSISIQTMDGSFHFFQKSNVEKIDIGSHSLMPDTYGSTLNNQEVNDLVSYLLDVGARSSNPSARKSPTPR